MNKDLKNKWVAALRSGNYIQGKRFLQSCEGDHTAYCCLGVLIDVYDSDFFNSNNPGDGYDLIKCDLGLSSEQVRNCWIMNDRENRSFNKIADYIQENL